jgi:HEAT repeat protein
MNTKELIEKLQSKNNGARAEAIAAAATAGPAAVPPLARLIANQEIEISRAGARALWKLVRQVGRPGAEQECGPVAAVLIGLLGEDQPAAVRRQVIWMLSEIGGREAADPLAKILENRELREDARAALERIPGEPSVAALQQALKSAPQDYRPAIAQSLRVRGVAVSEYPSRKLVPTKTTNVKVSGR